MKLSRDNLRFVLKSACFDCTAGALDNNTLEIEGYEHAQWTKFDPNDPNTYPPVGRHIIAYSPGHMSVLFRYSLATETDEQFADRFTQRYGFIHWRPLPPPPVETEVKK